MSYMERMDPIEELATLYIVDENTKELLFALEDLGFDGLTVQSVESGYGLYIDDVLITVAVDDDPIDAINELLDRTADLFYHDIPEV